MPGKKWIKEATKCDRRDKVGSKLTAGTKGGHVVSKRAERHSQRPVTCPNHPARVRLSLEPPEVVGHLRHAHLQVGHGHVGVEQRVQLLRLQRGNSMVRYFQPSMDQQSFQNTCSIHHTRQWHQLIPTVKSWLERKIRGAINCLFLDFSCIENLPFVQKFWSREVKFGTENFPIWGKFREKIETRSTYYRFFRTFAASAGNVKLSVPPTSSTQQAYDAPAFPYSPQT